MKKKQYVLFDDNSDTWDLATDKEVLAVLMENYRRQVEAKYLPDFNSNSSGISPIPSRKKKNKWFAILLRSTSSTR